MRASCSILETNPAARLPKSIGVPVGSVQLEDFEQTDCIFIMGHNIRTDAPRMLHSQVPGYKAIPTRLSRM